MAGSSTPHPGRPVRGSASGRPIMAAFDLLGRRWTLRVVGELGERPLGFNELQRAIGKVSTSVLATRLRELGAAGLVHADDEGRYGLSPLGYRLLLALAPLWDWSDAWADATGAERNAEVTEELRRATRDSGGLDPAP